MEFCDDMSYVDKSLVERGLIRAVPYQIRLDRFFTKKEMEENLAYAESHSEDERLRKCDEMCQKIAAENIALLEFIEKYFTISPYKGVHSYRDIIKDYTFYFWCNDLYNTTGGRLTGKDYSYVTLTLEKKDAVEENELIFEQLKKMFVDYPAKNIQAIFQYEEVENKDAVVKEAERIYKSCEGKFIKYLYSIGKLERYEGGYIFKKKYAKQYAYRVSPIEICANVSA